MVGSKWKKMVVDGAGGSRWEQTEIVERSGSTWKSMEALMGASITSMEDSMKGDGSKTTSFHGSFRGSRLKI